MLASETGKQTHKYWGLRVVSFGILGILYAVLMAAIAVMAIYALALVIIFLRLRIKELKAAQIAGQARQPK